MKEKLDSCVIFTIISELSNDDYKKYIPKLILEFLIWVDPRMPKKLAQSQAYGNLWNMESGLSNFHVKGKRIMYIKFYQYDKEALYSSRIIFRNHFSKTTLKNVHLVSDAFEKFLKQKRVKYTRTNKKRN